MQRFFLLLTVLATSLFGLNSCESVGDAQAVADEFYSALKTNDYTKALTFFDQTMFDEHGEDKVLALVKQRNTAWGTVLSYSKYGFNTSTNDGVTVVTLKFKVETEKGLVYERLEFIKRGDDYKLNGYFFNPEQSEIDNM